MVIVIRPDERKESIIVVVVVVGIRSWLHLAICLLWRNEVWLGVKVASRLLEFGKYWQDEIESLIDFFSHLQRGQKGSSERKSLGKTTTLTHLGPSQYNLARNENEQNHLWLDHSIDQSWEQLRLIRRVHAVAICKSLQSNWEANIA